MDRIVVVGTSGSGKSTLARQIGERLGHPVIELDSLHHLPGWEARPDDEFLALVADATAGERWVVDGNYTKAREVVWPRAEMVVWLDFPKRIVMSRIIRRTLRRVITREELWNGNREPWSNLWSTDPEKSVIAWAWTTHDRRRQEYAGMADDPEWSHIEFRRIPRPSQVKVFLGEIGG